MFVMKTLCLSILLSMSLFASSNEEKVKDLFTESQDSFMDKLSEDYLPKDTKLFLESSSKAINKGDSLYFLHYPKGSGFDYFAQDDSAFLKIGQLRAMAKSLGYEIKVLQLKRHMAAFKDKEALKQFYKKNFSTSFDDKKLEGLSFLKDEKDRIIFASKVCLVQLEKL